MPMISQENAFDNLNKSLGHDDPDIICLTDNCYMKVSDVIIIQNRNSITFECPICLCRVRVLD